jgi:hypothetical protein
MSEAIKPLSLGGVDRDDRPIVDVFERAYRLKSITRTVQRSLDKVDKDMRALMADDDADGDQLVGLLADAIDGLLEPEGNNRIPAKKVVLEKWKADELSLDGLRRFADDLQERAVAARPT